MPDITGSEILAKALKKERTEVLFFLMGGPMLETEMFCIREGIRPDGSVIGPPMPIPFLRGVSDQDLAAIIAAVFYFRQARIANLHCICG